MTNRFRTGSALLNTLLDAVQKQNRLTYEDRAMAARQYLDTCSPQELSHAIAELQGQQFRQFDDLFTMIPHSTFGFTIRTALAQWAATVLEE
jgi:hypothetical protein